jgi:hypothetical protein
MLSPTSTITIAEGQTIAVTLPAFPSGARADLFMSTAPDSTKLARVARGIKTTTRTLRQEPDDDAVGPPTSNTTGVRHPQDDTDKSVQAPDKDNQSADRDVQVRDQADAQMDDDHSSSSNTHTQEQHSESETNSDASDS